MVAATPESIVGTYDGIGEFVANSTWVLKPNGAANMLFEGEFLFKRRWSISDTGEVVVDGDRYKLTSKGDLVCDDMALEIIGYKRVKDIESTSETNPPSRCITRTTRVKRAKSLAPVIRWETLSDQSLFHRWLKHHKTQVDNNLIQFLRTYPARFCGMTR